MRRHPAFPQVVILGAGLLAIGLAMLAGRLDVLGVLLEPPPPSHLLLGAAAAIAAVVILLRAVQQVSDAAGRPRELIRGVRLVFLAVAAVAVAAGWLMSVPVAVVAGLVIAGIDVVETTFLLLVAGRDDDREGRARAEGGG